MFVEITNEPRDYAWGSTTLLPEFLGRAGDGRPQAELWLGTHPGSPSRVVGHDGDLREVAGELPFLLKLLAAGAPLSLQAHPDPERARAGFAREEAAGIPRDAPTRTYRDPFAKPEMILALSDEFRALSGFRPVADTRAILDAVDPGLLPALRTDADLLREVERLLTSDAGEEVERVVAAAAGAAGAAWDTVRLLAAHYPGDPGVVISLLLHSVTLRRGEALYLPAGNLHAYLGGLGVELMGPSDNVVRGGLTPKHVDVPELLATLDPAPIADPLLRPRVLAPGVEEFAPEGAGFRMTVLRGGEVGPVERAVVAVLEGSARVGGAAVDAPWFGYVDGETIEAAGLAVVSCGD